MLACVAITWWNYKFNSQGSGQSRMASIVEAWGNIVLGFAVNAVMNHWMFPLMTEGAELTVTNNLWGGWVYTLASMIRQLAIRRWFADRLHLFAARVAEKLS